MEAGVMKNFTCYQGEFGSWVSINKTEPEAWFRYLHFEEIRVFGELCKLIQLSYLIFVSNTSITIDNKYTKTGNVDNYHIFCDNIHACIQKYQITKTTRPVDREAYTPPT